MTKTRQPHRSPAVAAATPAQCPVAALADEARRLIDAYAAVDEAALEAREDRRKHNRLESVRSSVHGFIYGIVDRATFVRATSGIWRRPSFRRKWTRTSCSFRPCARRRASGRP